MPGKIATPLAGRNQYQNNFEIFDARTADEAGVFVTFSAAACRRENIAVCNPSRNAQRHVNVPASAMESVLSQGDESSPRVDVPTRSRR